MDVREGKIWVDMERRLILFKNAVRHGRQEEYFTIRMWYGGKVMLDVKVYAAALTTSMCILHGLKSIAAALPYLVRLFIVQ